MIPRLHKRTHTSCAPARRGARAPGLTGRELDRGHGRRPLAGPDDSTFGDEHKTWTLIQWAEHLKDPYLEHLFAVSPDDDRRAILHLDIRLHPDDRDLTGPEWTEVAHRLARAAGIEIPGKEHGCRWIAVQAQPRRLDLIANLIHLDGAWHAPPTDVLRRLAAVARRIEEDLQLIPVRAAPSARAGSGLRRHPRLSSRTSSRSSPTSRPPPGHGPRTHRARRTPDLIPSPAPQAATPRTAWS